MKKKKEKISGTVITECQPVVTGKNKDWEDITKKEIKLLHVFHTGASIGYYHRVLGLLKEQGRVHSELIGIGAYLRLGNPKKHDCDILSYQTFPDEFHRGKFNAPFIEEVDKQFLKFNGLKIISDAHDCSDADAFSRFPDSKEFPRIKSFPSKWFLENYNVIMIAGIAATDSRTFPDEFERDIEISCKFGGVTGDYYPHRIRESVVEQLNKFFPSKVNYNRVDGRKAYTEELRHTLISIGAPGWGPFSGTYHCALRAGALLFAHRTLNDIQYLPHADLIDGEDYVSYDLYNFHWKLKRLLDNPDEIARIRKNGRKKFEEGFSHNKSADILYNFITENL